MLGMQLPSFSAYLLLAAVGYFVVTLYIYGPFKIRESQTKSKQVEFVPIELASLPPDLSAQYFQAASAFASCGFRAVGHVRRRESTTQQGSFVSLWTNEEFADSVQIIGVITPSPVEFLRVVTLVAIWTEFTDGTSIITSNSSSGSCFPPNPAVSSIRCPHVHDLPNLYRFHRARVERARGGRTATLDRVSDAAARLKLEHLETFERLITAGYYASDDVAKTYVPTYYGALMMTYRLLPPFKQISAMRKNRAADKALRQLGFGGLSSLQESRVISASN